MLRDRVETSKVATYRSAATSKCIVRVDHLHAVVAVLHSERLPDVPPSTVVSKQIQIQVSFLAIILNHWHGMTEKLTTFREISESRLTAC